MEKAREKKKIPDVRLQIRKWRSTGRDGSSISGQFGQTNHTPASFNLHISAIIDYNSFLLLLSEKVLRNLI
ncbi:hypothetical protein L6452_40392 [Arctium lappa]|uniref:Uncharacterized protein n=1 Tax=Arctium lappa TaxID=4217 RepID=A0ACB8XL66_ARCLA|nr:hypothetical protein L6452_40392 [Arctium lappa]